MTTPSVVPDKGEVQDQRPAPPKGSAKVLADGEVTFALQREDADSSHFNTLYCRGKIVADWVMEPEVPDPNTNEFLQYPTRRVFVNDKVQIRIQIEGHVLPLTTFVRIDVRNGASTAMAITTDVPASAYEIQRALATSAGAAAMTEDATADQIYLETDPAGKRSFLVTTIEVPEWPSPGADTHDLLTYDAVVRVCDKAVQYEAMAPPLEVVRWWAMPSQNLGIVRAPCPTVAPLIDGEDFFAELAATLSGASAGQSIFLASWSFRSLSFLTGGAGGPDAAAAAALDPDTVLAPTMAGAIRTAAQNGANVYILLDFFNAGWASWLFGKIQATYGSAAANVFVRISAHPHTFSVGIGPFSVTKQAGSYHEKYVCLTGNGAWKTLIGGIDCEPDRLNPIKHGWKTNYLPYRTIAEVQLAIAPGKHPLESGWFFPDEFSLWHDVGVRMEGQDAVQFLADDFVRRWNGGTQGGNHSPDLPAVAFTAPPVAVATVQMVKTDEIRTPPSVGRAVGTGTYFGTRDVWSAAIREARHYIYIENQYLRDPTLRDLICARLEENPILQVIIIVPYRSEEARKFAGAPPEKSTDFSLFLGIKYLMGNEDERGALEADMQDRMNLHGDYLQHEFITKLRAADPDRVGVFTLAKQLPGAPKPEEIYPHAKLMLIDDTWAYIGSSNANGRSLSRDAESGYVIHDRTIATNLRHTLWQEHLSQEFPTRDIRNFLTHWNALAAPVVDQPADCDPGNLVDVQAVKLGEPAKGQEYNGAFSWTEDADLEV
jgi:phosphatidylserine/phosphatidylglycerophosphate/cardiolipin synthase-like enzyme